MFYPEKTSNIIRDNIATDFSQLLFQEAAVMSYQEIQKGHLNCNQLIGAWPSESEFHFRAPLFSWNHWDAYQHMLFLARMQQLYIVLFFEIFFELCTELPSENRSNSLRCKSSSRSNSITLDDVCMQLPIVLSLGNGYRLYDVKQGNECGVGEGVTGVE